MTDAEREDLLERIDTGPNHTRPHTAYLYARDTVKGRCPEIEHIVLRDQDLSVLYAKNVVHGRWPECEGRVSRLASSAFSYSSSVLKSRWPEGENAIMGYPYWSYMYSLHVLKGRWANLTAESYLFRSEYKDVYLRRFPDAKDDWVAWGWLDWLE